MEGSIRNRAYKRARNEWVLTLDPDERVSEELKIQIEDFLNKGTFYDAYSVWKSKHMIKMAKFQAKSKVFAGLLVPYKKNREESKLPKKGKVSFKGVKTAILGGGDVAFPLLFIGAVMKSMMMRQL